MSEESPIEKLILSLLKDNLDDDPQIRSELIKLGQKEKDEESNEKSYVIKLFKTRKK